jgi:hypothetical protein
VSREFFKDKATPNAMKSFTTNHQDTKAFKTKSHKSCFLGVFVPWWWDVDLAFPCAFALRFSNV